jgi:hypothetical protein
MPYFQNPFDQEFRGNWIIGDRQYTLNFNIPGNINSSTLMLAWTAGPYDFSSVNTLTIKYAIDPTLKQFQTLNINVSGVTPSATQAWEVTTALNNNPVFAALWTAVTVPTASSPSHPDTTTPPMTVSIRAKRPQGQIKAYIANTGAETKMKFNLKAPIRELPSYFSRHAVANVLTYSDSVGLLVALDTNASYDASLISAQNQDPNTVQPDWQLLKGRAGYFNFRKQTLDGSSRLSTILDYPAGAVVGDLAKLTQYVYSGGDTIPSKIMEIPHVLTSDDLITPT